MSGEMVYGSTMHTPELLAGGVYKFHCYAITSMGTHPCAYVQIPESSPLYKAKVDLLEDLINCHGGVTYTGDLADGLPGLEPGGFWIGWDYAHYGDFLGGLPDGCGGKKWDTEEMVAECRAVIDQLAAWKYLQRPSPNG